MLLTPSQSKINGFRISLHTLSQPQIAKDRLRCVSLQLVSLLLMVVELATLL